ncbi:MAG: hypothetical protein U0N32_06045 [Oscillospiraceae bacterium]
MAEDMNTAFTADADDWSDITADSFSDVEDDAQGAPDTETQSNDAAPEIEQNDGGQDADAAQPGENEEQQAQTDGQLFELKHLGETKNVNRDEVVTLAQKGMDYDRVTEKNTQLENQVSEQKQQLAQLTEHENALQELAKQSGTTVEELVENMLIAVTKSKYGIDDDGMALERVKLERERRALDQERAALATKNQEQEQQAANEKWRGECFDAFAKAYPDVDPASIPNGVWEAFNRGETLVSAYARERNKALEAEIARMKSEQETRDRNAANAARSTGSQSSAGKTGSDEAFDALWYDGN